MFSCAAATAQDQWSLATADFNTETVVLQSIGPSGVTVAAGEGQPQRTISMDDFLELRRSALVAHPAGKLALHLTGGDQLLGQPLALKADSLVWDNPLVGKIDVPTSRLVAITPAGKEPPADRPREDVVALSNGDSVHGIIASLTDQKITIQSGSQSSDVPFSSVTSISFAATGPAASPGHGFRIHLEDGSSLISPDAAVKNGSLLLELGKGAKRTIALSHVMAIEQVNGPVSWLSSRTPSREIYYPFIGPPRQPAAYIDRAWGGQRSIQFKEQRFAHGIGVHAYSRLSWPLDGSFAAFRTRYAVDGDSTLADVTVRIRLDDKIVYQCARVRAGVLSPVVILKLDGAKLLTLEVDGGAGYTQDSFDWIEPALLRHQPKPPPATQPAATQPAEHENGPESPTQ